MPKPRQPIALLEAKGRKHLTRDEIENRKKQEIIAPAENVGPPKYLSAKQKREFSEAADILIRLDIMSDLDVDSLASFFVSRDLWVKYTKEIQKAMRAKTVDWDLVESLSRLQDKAFKQTRASAGDNGLTITSRCRLVVPKTEAPKENKFKAKFGGG